MREDDPFRPVTPVLNATGDVFARGLSGPPLAAGISDALASATRYARLDEAHVERQLETLTGAGAVRLVHAGAAATLLALSALRPGRRIVVARGELGEDANGVRLSELIAHSGGALVEIGAANCARLEDYERALGEDAVIVRSHPWAYGVRGLSEQVPLSELATLVRKIGARLLVSEESGELRMVRRALAEGADLVVFPCDRMLGGPAAGVLAGRADLIAAAKAHPLSPVLALDPLRLTALSATLALWVSGREAELPVVRMLGESLDTLGGRAALLAAALGDEASVARLDTATRLPSGQPAESMGIVIQNVRPHELAERLREGEPPVMGRVARGALLLDVRTLADRDVMPVARAVRQALAAMARETSEGPLLRSVTAGDGQEGRRGEDVLTEA